jgi:putative chitinase
VITAKILLQINPNITNTSAKAAAINTAMERFGIDTPKRQAHFLGQLLHESGHLENTRENFNYSAAGLLKTWPSRFKNLVDAQFYERQPAKIANFVYANRMGNGNEASGDGWKFRGAGWFQIPGRSLQKECAQGLGISGEIGDYLCTINGAALSAGWYWWSRGCNRYADMNNVDAVSDLINLGHLTAKVGDSIGYTKRLDLTNSFLKAFGVNP